MFKFETKVDARDRHQESFVQVVELYQKRIKDLIISAGKRFADKSEELDRTFPQRVLKTILDPSISNNIYTKEMIDELRTRNGNLTVVVQMDPQMFQKL